MPIGPSVPIVENESDERTVTSQWIRRKMVRPEGFELSTFWFLTRRSPGSRSSSSGNSDGRVSNRQPRMPEATNSFSCDFLHPSVGLKAWTKAESYAFFRRVRSTTSLAKPSSRLSREKCRRYNSGPMTEATRALGSSEADNLPRAWPGRWLGCARPTDGWSRGPSTTSEPTWTQTQLLPSEGTQYND